VGGCGWYQHGGIQELGQLIVSRPVEVAADLRELFSVGLSEVPPAEAVLLVRALMRDPRSRLHAGEAGWDYPISREWLLLADLWDLQLQKAVRRGQFKPYPRPFGKQKLGGRRRRSVSEALRILRPQN
jgi:hypothetical protein